MATTLENPPPLPNLPMQLMLLMGTWLTSPFALACAKSGSPRWNPRDPNLQNALAAESKNRAAELLSGVLRYLETPYVRDVAEPPAIWKRGNARLLDYGGSGGVVLFVPSLINRCYILDLDKERSLLRYLASAGVQPVALDWGEPGEFERDFDCGKYVTEILLPAIEFLYQTTGKPVTLVGYCMGGVLALAAAQMQPKCVNGLALLATPWDFHCRDFAPFVVDEKWHALIDSLIASRKTLPADIIQSLFYWTDPFVFDHKFRRFAGMAGNSAAAHEFVALEHWVNDGVPMTAAVARECLIGWAQENRLARGEWQAARGKIEPKKIKQPVFIAMPKNDHVVPHDCAAPLAKAIPHARIINPGAGHVGMVVGRQAKKELWQPLAEWLVAL